jgi:hypothetical protein
MSAPQLTVTDVSGQSQQTPVRPPTRTKSTRPFLSPAPALPTVQEDAVSETSTWVQNRLQIDRDAKNPSKSVEVIVDEKFHRLFDSETLLFDKHPPKIGITARFNQDTLTDISETKLTAEDRTRLSELRSFTEIREMMNTKFSFKEGRLSSTLDILAQYMRGQKILYLEAKAYCEFYLYRLMIPTIVISSACSVVSGVFSDLAYAAIAVAGASAFNTLLLALINYFKLDARAEAHRMTAYSFDQLISECEFTSGKILLSNLVQDEDLTEDAEHYKLKDVQDFMSLIENKVKEIKQKNQFIIPDSIRHAFPNIYYTNIFALVTQSQIQEMIITNQLKLACNAFAEVENQIIKGDRSPEVYLDFNFKQRQKNNLIERILDHRMNMVAFDQVLRLEVERNRKRCLWIRCCY